MGKLGISGIVKRTVRGMAETHHAWVAVSLGKFGLGQVAKKITVRCEQPGNMGLKGRVRTADNIRK